MGIYSNDQYLHENDMKLCEAKHTLYKFICNYCGKEFVNKIKTRKYCSVECARLNRLGRKYSDETKKKISVSNIGKHFHVGKPISEEQKKQISVSNKGRKHTENVKRKMSDDKKKLFLYEDVLIDLYCNNFLSADDIGAIYGVSNYPVYRLLKEYNIPIINHSDWNKGKKHSEEELTKMSIANKGIARRVGFHHSEETKDKMSKNSLHKPCSEEHKQQLRNIQIGYWSDPAWVKKWIASNKVKPNKEEIRVFNLLNCLFPNDWKYIGDFSLMIGRRNPDFICVSKPNLLLEFFGDYWHKDDDTQERIDYFKQYGYNTLVIWQSELKNIELVSDKIINFVENYAISK